MSRNSSNVAPRLASAGDSTNETFVGSKLTRLSGDDPDSPYVRRKILSANGIWGRVVEMQNGCWEWQGARTGDGYAGASFGKKYFPIHRLICEIFNGPLGFDEEACHACENPKCINPKHLSAGSHKDNMGDILDSRGKGRKRKLSDSDIVEIRRLYADGSTRGELAKRFHCTSVTIGTYLGAVPRGSKALPAKQLEEAQELRASGWTYAKIAEKYGISAMGVHRILYKAARRREADHARR